MVHGISNGSLKLLSRARVLPGKGLVAWWLDMTLLQALLLDIGFAIFFIAYAFACNWAYDIVFPVARA